MTKICVIGAGPSGLSQLRAFASTQRGGTNVPDFEIVCFEKRSDTGGLWNYTWRTGLDEHGEPVHESMYRNLWSNVPKECMEYADYPFERHFNQPLPSFLPRAVLLDYLRGRNKSNLEHAIIYFSTVVRWVEYSDTTSRFTVTVKDLKNDQMRSEEFDYVIVATGHFSTPNAPAIEGIETFPGPILHSHDFRGAEQFAGKHVLVVGGNVSAEDIALQCHKYGATSAVISYRSRPMGYKWPTTVEEIPLLTKVECKVAHFKNGESREVDAIIFCTGYQHHFPFLPDNLRLRTTNRFYPLGLYKGIFWEKNLRLIYIGMQNQIFSFVMFDIQACYARDVILGRISLPSDNEMAADIRRWADRQVGLTTQVTWIDFQTDYIRDLITLADYPSINLDGLNELFKEWDAEKKNRNIVDYRNRGYASTLTGNIAPVHHTAWIEALDDSATNFLDMKDKF